MKITICFMAREYFSLINFKFRNEFSWTLNFIMFFFLLSSLFACISSEKIAIKKECVTGKKVLVNPFFCCFCCWGERESDETSKGAKAKGSQFES